MRGLLAASLLGWAGNLISAPGIAAESKFEVQMLEAPAAAAVDAAAAPDATLRAIAGGSLDAQFAPLASTTRRRFAGTAWLRLKPADPSLPAGIPVVVMHAARQLHAELFAARGDSVVWLPRATQLPGFRGTQDTVFALREGIEAGQVLYARIEAGGNEPQAVAFYSSTLDRALARGALQARMIALTFGALTVMALAALLLWFVLADALFGLYATLFFLQALYVAYLSGQGFDWPVLSYALPLNSFAWNVPVGLGGAVACLFTREIADLRHFSPRVYAAFGWFAVAFVIVTVANLAKLFGWGTWVNAIGNLVFLVAAIFTVIVAFLAWRRGNRAAGWFLIAWGLLEGFTITARRCAF